MAHLPRRVSALAAASTLVFALAGCSDSGGDDKESSGGGSDESASSSPTASPSPSASKSTKPSASKPASATPSPSEPAASEPASEATPSGLPTPGTGTPSAALVQKMLTPKQLPGLNDQTVWSENTTGTEGDTPFGDCQKAAITDIGATGVVVRTYDAHGSQAGAQLIAQFADPKSAQRAHEVLKSWRDDCRKRLDAAVRKVSPMTDLSSPKGIAQSYLVQYGARNADEHNFHGVGITRVGAQISIVTIDVLGQDYNYEPGQEPASRAATLAAGRL